MKCEIFLVDDNPADSRLIIEAFKQIEGFDLFNFSYAYDGEEAVSTLKSSAKVGKPFHLIILDINLPRVNGKEVLAFIKSTDRLKDIPVIVCSNSDYEKDIDEVHRLKADGYIQKPQNFVDIVNFASSIHKNFSENKKVVVEELLEHFSRLQEAV